MIEIERKFLVTSDLYRSEASEQSRIVQGFLNTDKMRTVRIRIKGDKGFLTIKGESSDNGLCRFEWEKEISLTEAENLLKLCEKGIIEKIRYEVKVGNHIFEVDEFYGDNKGLVIAEVELTNETEVYDEPKWLGKEITGDKNYYNSQLSKRPYKNW